VGVILGSGRTYQGVTNQSDPSDLAGALFREHSARVYAYARRHVDEADCDDVVSETFVVALRRPERVPADPLPWLIVVARNVIANQRRTSARADLLWFSAVRAFWSSPTTASPEDAVTERDRMLAALATCTRAEREALLLVAWDGLSPAQAADVAGCSVRAFTVRLHRARRRLGAALEAADAPHAATRPAATPAAAQAAAPRPTTVPFAVQEPS
jgi:RNA polymerase sigma-70 factor (ECF subfamily)